MALHINFATVSLPNVWLNGHNLFTVLGLSHVDLLSELVARVQKRSLVQLVLATGWARCCATLPITGHSHCIVEDEWCQLLQVVVE